MKKTELSLTAIDTEIGLCKNIISKLKVELDELTERSQILTERIKVMDAIDDMLPTGETKLINKENIRLASEERFNLIPEINKKDSTIMHYEKIIECLHELKKEVQKNM